MLVTRSTRLYRRPQAAPVVAAWAAADAAEWVAAVEQTAAEQVWVMMQIEIRLPVAAVAA